MAAINLTGASGSPFSHRYTSAVTWQEIQLPTWAKAVVVTPHSADARVAFSSSDGTAPVDGAAVGTHFQTVKDAASFSFPVAGSTAGTSVFVAAASGTPAIEILLVV